MSSFFTTPASQKKRKRAGVTSAVSRKRTTVSAAKTAPAQPKSQPRRERDESISASGSDEENGAAGLGSIQSGEESSGLEDETADERRLRLAQRYLDNIRQEVNEDPYAFDAAHVDRDLIAERLKEDVAQNKGKLHRFVVEELDFARAGKTQFSADQNGVTAVATIEPHAFTASQDGSLCKWRLRDVQHQEREEEHAPEGVKRRPELIRRFKAPRTPKDGYQGHDFNAQILCLAAPMSGKYLVTGGTDRKIVVWDPASFKPIKAFSHHRGAVVSLSFRRGTHTLYSASTDRTCKVWSLDEMGYVQTLFGHQDQVVDIGGMASEQFVSVGARDRTARLFKVIEEQQLVFRGSGGGPGTSSKPDKSLSVTNGVNGDAPYPRERETIFEEGSIDRIGIIDEETFVTGSDNGALSLWSIQRKKPVFTVALAHGLDPPSTLAEAYAEASADEGELLTPSQRPGRAKPRWITALLTIPLADLILTGSWDGAVRVWRVTKDRRRLEAAGTVGIPPAHPSSDGIRDGSLTVNGHGASKNGRPHPAHPKPEVRGVINELAVFERGEKGKEGLCVVAAVSKSHRLGNFLIAKGQGVKNGAVVFEVPMKQRDVEVPIELKDGANGVASVERGDSTQV